MTFLQNNFRRPPIWELEKPKGPNGVRFNLGARASPAWRRACAFWGGRTDPSEVHLVVISGL
eukprot:CAMPEP_0180131262 /NCGR_PEP_ID=MMETSP0986-20121125/8321_1 /TAXON_ID=697907 /ORGANISM="non described non described, Strain CCMP2293" /LENGTH=61 /DNA_ID=CAMNT_0022071117 /DNA_START=157 /DNA_END=342 /DNA_ORIENTATION=+